MEIEISTPWITIYTTNPVHFPTQAITVRYNDIESVRLVKSLEREGCEGTGAIELVCKGEPHWFRYTDYIQADEDYRKLVEWLQEVG